MSRFLHWAQPGDLALPYFLASLAIELYLKAFLVSRLGELPVALTRGNRGHNLPLLLEHARTAAESDSVLSDIHLAQVLERLGKMNIAGRYTNTGFAIRGLTSDLWNILDAFTYHLRSITPFPQDCRDETVELLRWPSVVDRPDALDSARQALRDGFFAFNRPYGGWFLTEDGKRVKQDGSAW